ncbi:MAG TPA: heme lyase CcmF/NrfE family subunit [Stellaceae bacterium]|nr:heme lyase CcmF/NrfE family subunit [Stellaceae bacterium]
MIGEVGHFALVLALVVAVVQAGLPLAGATRGNAAWMAVARPAALLQFGCVALAFAALMHAYVTSDFSLRNVVENSHSAKPLLYKITGLWSNHEGSMLLWVLMLTGFGAAVALFGENLPMALKARVLAVQAMIGVGFLGFILFTSNPFARAFPVPPDGQGLNPILQDPGLAFHPPMLYLGYVGFSMAFSFAVAALLEGRVDAAWARWVRPWTLVAWCALTLGIALGSWWAYYELGWGGWWAWDPVENASFMPWLAGTALLHSAIVAEKRDALKSWTILLALVTFALSLIGTFLVRSGVLSSVHAFAVDPTRGAYILGLLVVVIGGSLTLYAVRAPALNPTGQFAPISRESGLVLNNLLLSTAALTVFLGTLYPLFLDAVGGGKVSVGAPYYNATFVPLMVPLVAVMGVGPLLSWKRADLAGVLLRLRLAAGLAVAVAVGTLWGHVGGGGFAVLGLALAAWLLGATVTELVERLGLRRGGVGGGILARARHLPRSAWGMTLAHAGLAVSIAGISVSAGGQVEHIAAMHPGDQAEVAGYVWRFDGTEPVTGPNYTADRAHFTVSRNGRFVAEQMPELRRYPLQGMTVADVAIHTNGLADLYVVLGDKRGTSPEAAPDAAQATSDWVVRIYYNPLVPWIWFGAGIMAFGGIVSLTDRRLRIGAPVRRRHPAGAAEAAGA